MLVLFRTLSPDKSLLIVQARNVDAISKNFFDLVGLG